MTAWVSGGAAVVAAWVCADDSAADAVSEAVVSASVVFSAAVEEGTASDDVSEPASVVATTEARSAVVLMAGSFDPQLQLDNIDAASSRTIKMENNRFFITAISQKYLIMIIINLLILNLEKLKLIMH